jgi:protein-S-isoprenylcysteine O-methyltransferase Ste14
MGTLLYRATICYALLAVLYDTVLIAAFCGRLVPEHLGYPLGAFLCVFGVLVYALGTLTVYRAIDDRRLATRGLYAIVRHPLYAAWIWCLVPGVALLAGTPLVLAPPLVAAVCYRLCIPHEKPAWRNISARPTGRIATGSAASSHARAGKKGLERPGLWPRHCGVRAGCGRVRP